ncbi:MAG TPA: hypothetical protein VIJ42_07620 [Stellaceae bacterium]
MQIRIRQHRITETDDDYVEVTTLTIVAARTEPMWRQYTWTLPELGAWVIELDRLSPEGTSAQAQSRSFWQVLQSFRPEYPLAFSVPVAITAVRVRATYQLNGQLDTLSGIVSRLLPDWDADSGTWITRATRSPAAALRRQLQAPTVATPAADSDIDLDLLADWSEWCAAKNLKYDRVHNQDMSLWDALGDIAAAGRATPRNDGVKWGVVIDRPQDLIIDHVTPRNARNFSWSRTYPDPPDAMHVTFFDETNDYQQSDRVIPWPGHTGDIVVTEELSLPGKTDSDEIWIEARRRNV